MIGNDIVDLFEAKRRSNWRRKGYLEKIFSVEEQSIILNSSNPEKVLWVIWSVKESVYKASVKFCNEKYFFPKKYEYLLINFSNHSSYEFSEGEIFHNNFLYKAESVITENFISTIAFIKSFKPVIIKMNIEFSESSYKIQHSELYSSVLRKISDIYNYPVKDFKISKDESGVPYIYMKNTKLNCDISLSHHGKYGAYVVATK